MLSQTLYWRRRVAFDVRAGQLQLRPQWKPSRNHINLDTSTCHTYTASQSLSVIPNSSMTGAMRTPLLSAIKPIKPSPMSLTSL